VEAHAHYWYRAVGDAVNTATRIQRMPLDKATAKEYNASASSRLLLSGDSMSGYLGKWRIFVALLALSACTAPRAVSPLEDGEPTELRLRTGDSIRVVTKQRKRMSLHITEIRPTELAGVTAKPAEHESLPAGQDVVVPYADIALVEVRRFSAARSVAGPALVILVTGGIALATTPIMMGP
jgi:hypothetical protein